MRLFARARLSLVLAFLILCPAGADAADFIRDLQTAAIAAGNSPVGYWGAEPEKYTAWGTHSNRLIPVYTFGTRGAEKGIDLDGYTGPNSAYRSEAAIRQIYGKVPTNTLNPDAEYLDQTDLATLQRAAFAAGKKHVFLIIFDGMDWDSTRNAAIYNRRKVPYSEGRGTGLHFLDYTAGGTTQFGWMVTTPHNEGTKVDVDKQTVLNPGGKIPGGYNAAKAGPNPWTPGNDPFYAICKTSATTKNDGEHAYPDSSATASAMTSAVKSYNGSVNVDVTGNRVSTVAHEVQEKGFSVGVVTSVPITHATPACAYAHNVSRDDFQDLTRDMLGLRSVSHPNKPLRGVDVLIGGGFGDEKKQPDDKPKETTTAGEDEQTELQKQGKNLVYGNRWITPADLKAVNVTNGGKYVVSMRTAGTNGGRKLDVDACSAAISGTRLFGFYGVGKAKGHLPFRTADGDFKPAPGRTKKAEEYTPADVTENPTLAEMTSAALMVLEKNPKGFWMMLEAGDVDWANHDNNLDNSIGAVLSGDEAVKVVTDWVEKHSSWKDALVIVTADHGHYFHLARPELLTGAAPNP